MFSEDEYKDGLRLLFNVFLGTKKKQRLRIDLVRDWVPEELTEMIVPADRMTIEGVATFDYRAIPVSYALADKYLGITDLHNGRPSSRVKDLVDIVLYATHCRVDEAQLRQKLEIEFRMRHRSLPDEFKIPLNWHGDYGAVYRKVALDAHVLETCPTLGSAESMGKLLYDPVFSGACRGLTWDPERLSWK